MSDKGVAVGDKLKPRRPLTRALRNTFIAGLVILIPIVLTAKALWWLFAYVDGLAGPLAVRMVGRPIPGIGFVTTIVIVFLAGVLLSRGPLRRLLESFEDVLDAIPFVGTVYGTTKKVLAGFGKPESQSVFQKFVLARLPGRTTPGFLTGTFTLKRRDQARGVLLRRLHPHQPPLRGRRGWSCPRPTSSRPTSRSRTASA